ncbi:MAG TPA: hypothetical protein PKH77_22360 [Anaerolineae bacterium]|nr:hypothetical protein [Anaerolineae bacterium]
MKKQVIKLAERYHPSYGTGLIPESTPFLEDIVAFFMQDGDKKA